MTSKTRKQRYREITSADNKDFNATVIELAEVYLKDFPDSKGAWAMYGLALYSVNRSSDAKKAFRKLFDLTDDSDESVAWYFCKMGHIYRDSGNYRKAIEWYQKAHLTKPSEASFLIFKGVLLSRIEKYDDAAATLIEATKCPEGFIDEAFYNLGAVRIAQKRYEEASICFVNALEIDPKYKEARQQLKDVKKILETLALK